MESLISIIIPVYNTEKYLSKCVDSLLGQTYKNLEIILVNDGSTDTSGAICNKYAETYPNIKIRNLETNGGQGRARNNGLELVTGEYIMFCDSDDTCDPDMAEHLYNAIASHDECDVAVCGLRYVFEDRVVEKCVYKKPFITDKAKIITMYFHEDQILSSPANKIYKRAVFKKLKFPEGMIYEDRFVSLEIFLNHPFIYFTGEPKYNYLMRQGSTLRSEFSYKNLDYLNCCENDIKLIGEFAPQYMPDAQICYLFSISHLLKKIIIGGYKKYKKTYDELLALLKNRCIKHEKSTRKKLCKYSKFYRLKHGTIFYYTLRSRIGRILRKLPRRKKSRRLRKN